MRDEERERDEGMGREGKGGEKLLFSFERQLIVFRKPCGGVGVIGPRKRKERHKDRQKQAANTPQKECGNHFSFFHFFLPYVSSHNIHVREMV